VEQDPSGSPVVVGALDPTTSEGKVLPLPSYHQLLGMVARGAGHAGKKLHEYFIELRLRLCNLVQEFFFAL